MADFNTRNINLAISSSPESALNTNHTNLGTEFTAAITNALAVTLPSLERIYDNGLIGTGNEFPTTFINDYSTNPRATLSDRINTNQFMVLAARALSGSVTTTAGNGANGVQTGNYKHVVKMQLPGSNPVLKSSTLAAKFGGLNVLMASMVVNALSWEFQGRGPTTYSAELVGTGKIGTPTGTYPSPVAQNYMASQAAATMTYVEKNGSTNPTINLAGRVRSFSGSLNNNVITGDGRLGDPLRVSGDVTQGAYFSNLTRGDRSLTARVALFADDTTYDQWSEHIAGYEVEDFTYTAIGKKIGSTTDNYTVKIIFPRSTIDNVNYEDASPKLGVSFDLVPILKAGEPGLLQMEFITNISTLA